MSKKDDIQMTPLDYENLSLEDIVCLRGPKNLEGINCKKSWLKGRFADGLKFHVLKINGRSWGLIEYLPAEKAWRPIEAPGYMFIDCLWVIGRYKGQGFGEQLLARCINDSKGKNGIVTVTSNKPFTTKKDLFIKNGFEICDSAPPHFELLVKKFQKSALNPKFKENAKREVYGNKRGLIFFYSDQCPYIVQSMKEMREVALKRKIPFEEIKIKSKEDAQNSPSAYGTFSIFYNGYFLTHEPFYGKKFDKLLSVALLGNSATLKTIKLIKT